LITLQIGCSEDGETKRRSIDENVEEEGKRKEGDEMIATRDKI